MAILLNLTLKKLEKIKLNSLLTNATLYELITIGDRFLIVTRTV